MSQITKQDLRKKTYFEFIIKTILINDHQQKNREYDFIEQNPPLRT